MRVVFTEEVEDRIPYTGQIPKLAMDVYNFLTVDDASKDAPAKITSPAGVAWAWCRMKGLPFSRYIEVYRIEFETAK